jgi:hypothetical protein
MLLSYYRLNHIYNRYHFGGVIVLLIGITVTVIGSAINDSSHNDANGNGNGPSVIINVILLITAVIPLAIAFVYIEENLKRHHQSLSVPFLWFLICCCQFPIGMLLAPLNAVIQGIPISDIPHNMVDGLTCLYLSRSPSSSTQPWNITRIDMNVMNDMSVSAASLGNTTSENDACANVLTFYLLHLPPAIIFNLCMGQISRYGSATLMWFLRTASLPISSLLFTTSFIMGNEAQSFDVFVITGLVVVCCGLTLYISKGQPIDPSNISRPQPSLPSSPSAGGYDSIANSHPLTLDPVDPIDHEPEPIGLSRLRPLTPRPSTLSLAPSF